MTNECDILSSAANRVRTAQLQNADLLFASVRFVYCRQVGPYACARDCYPALLTSAPALFCVKDGSPAVHMAGLEQGIECGVGTFSAHLTDSSRQRSSDKRTGRTFKAWLGGQDTEAKKQVFVLE